MHEDTIVAETRKLREELMNEVGRDLGKLFDHLNDAMHGTRNASSVSRRVVR